ncbi:MAG TPA: hypothetical protein P5102_10700 [Candidatus Competibacteraceae bacterium]|nr:hypothetical protein [Candidatus Competibacteraceae bacterium]HRZ06597.1 hypothetical protein [Candidatus Competibacteraceae bacterium]HSA46701.1 hypothetical protein [Candidatus Competibacteraceae bacterium]
MLYLDIPSMADLTALAEYRNDMSVSIFLPTTPVSQETEADRILLKNLAKEGLKQLEGADKRRVAALAEELDDLIDDDAFWCFQAHGLVIYATPDNLRTFRVPNALEPLVKVSDRFHLKPLLRSITFCNTCYVLALADGGVRLIEVSADLPAVEVKLAGMPKDAASAVGKASISVRSYSGRLGGSEGKKVRLRQYARQVDTVLRGLLSGSDTPLVLAAVESLGAIYRSVSTYPHLLPEGLEGNPERKSEAELASAARVLLDEVYRGRITAWRALFEQRGNEGRASADIVQVARAATFGAVQSLLVDMDHVVHGTVAETDGAVTLAAGPSADSYGVVDEIARRVLLSGGQVLSVRQADIPDSKPLAAILRYAV